MQKLVLEIIWWAVTAVIVAAILFPIWQNVNNYPVYWQNIMFIILFVTLTRYIFLLKYTFLSHIQWLKVLLVLIIMPCFFFLLEHHNAFQKDLDNIGMEYVTQGVAYEKAVKLGGYIKSQFTFFSVGTLIAVMVFPIRMIISVWRLHNKGTV